MPGLILICLVHLADVFLREENETEVRKTGQHYICGGIVRHGKTYTGVGAGNACCGSQGW